MNDKTGKADLGKPSGFRDLVGYRTIHWVEGHAIFEVEIGPEHHNSSGFLHGGVYMTILDAAMGHASTWCNEEGHVRPCVTLSLTANFVAVARTPIIRAKAWLQGVAGRAAVCHGEVVDAADNVCLTGNGSYRYLRGGEALAGIPRPVSHGDGETAGEP